ncbi:MAG TPA: APC family permease [Gaiellaceae bacterium]|nr:APC family permease [Gaiellaceae bacterium]
MAGLRELEPRSPRLKRVMVGRPMASDRLDETLLPKWLALPIFASDPLSSVAYATEAALVVLVTASATAAHLAFPISLAIAGLLGIVVLSYRQTVQVYESSGGAYVVAKENLGKLPSLVAAAALLTDYVLTVAVSVAAGVLALTSAVSSLRGHELALSLGSVALIALANLRGVKEAGILFALPTYGFVMSIFALIGVGITKCATGSCPQATVPHPLLAGTGAVTIFVVLRAFSSGSTALTGVEAIANGVNAFRRPHGRNAAATMLILGTMAIAMFLGVSWLAVHMHARPTMTGTPSVLSELARGVFPSSSTFGFMYWVVQTLTLGVLILAANTSYQGFPRLAALLARDRFFARQFTNLGDRLVFSNGIIVLTAIAMALLWAYNASVNSLIHLYVIGVFTAFTLSQFGMVRYWLRTRDRGWSHRIVVNAVGATATGVVTLVVVWTKFAEGAWLVTVAIPLLVVSFLGVNRHYRRFARRLRAGVGAVTAARPLTNEVLLAVGSIDAATERALWYAHRISVPGRTRALLVPGSHTDSGIRARWWSIAGDSPRLEVLSNDEGRVHTLLEEVWRLPRGESDFVTLLVPEQFSRASLLTAAGRSSFRLKLRLLSEPGVVVTGVPAVTSRREPEPAAPKRLVVRVLLANIHAGSLRALNYAASLGVDDTRAVSFAFDEAEAARFQDEYVRAGVAMPLDLSDAPFRDIGTPLLSYLRDLTSDGETVVNVVMPEVVVRGWARLLHNQRALYIKRLLLFEQRVLLSSVPYQLFR